MPSKRVEKFTVEIEVLKRKVTAKVTEAGLTIKGVSADEAMMLVSLLGTRQRQLDDLEARVDRLDSRAQRNRGGGRSAGGRSAAAAQLAAG